MTLLIVNADDYGLTEATSRAVIDCHHKGIVTSTSVLTLAPAFRRTARWLAEQPELGVGVHLALVGEDPPLLSAREVPSLVDSQGRLPRSWRGFVARAMRGQVDPDDVEREWNAQISLALATTGSITHLDSHQHLHQWPPLFKVVRRLASSAGVGAIRTTAFARMHPLAVLGKVTRRRARTVGLRTTDRFVGFAEAGRLDQQSLLGLLSTLPTSGSVELGCHPGARSDHARVRYRWDYQWFEEYTALTSAAAHTEILLRGIRLGSFADLL